MFTILLVMLVIVVWVATKVAHAASKVIESVGDPRDRICKLNGQYHQFALDAKQEGAKMYVHLRKTWQKGRAS